MSQFRTESISTITQYQIQFIFKSDIPISTHFKIETMMDRRRIDNFITLAPSAISIFFVVLLLVISRYTVLHY